MLSVFQDHTKVLLKIKRFYSPTMRLHCDGIKPSQLIAEFFIHKCFPPFKTLFWIMPKVKFSYFDNTMLDKFVQSWDIVDDLVLNGCEELVNLSDGNVPFLEMFF